MDSFPLSGQNTAAPTAPTGRGPATAHFNEGNDFEHTIRVKTPASGSIFFNRYRLDRVLGRGGMGVVWLADDLKLERPVALKFLPSLLGLDSAAVKELKTETRRGLELSHPNIVRIYDFVDDEELAAISMEFVDGKTLSELRLSTEHGVFSVPQVMQWLPGVIAALDYAHFHRKLVHRDLKPANIMATTKENLAKVADFGIARSLSDTMSRLSAAQMGTSGTLPYMSPQQAMGERPMPTDDVYSLGATIYELLSGKPPFYRGDISTQITSKVPSSMLERREELEIRAADSIPKEWENAIAMCLRKDPSQRPQSAGALAEMLGLPTSLTSGVTKTFVSTKAPAPQHAGKSRLPLYAAAAVVVLGGAAAAYHFTRPAAGVAAASGKTPSSLTADPAVSASKPAPGPASVAASTPAAAEVMPAAPGAALPEPATTAAPAAPSASSTPSSATTAGTAGPESSPMAVPALPPTVPAAPVSPSPVAVTAPAAPALAAPAPNGAPAVPMSTAVPGATPGEAPPSVPVAAALPPVPGAAPSPALVQPPVTDPPNGHWPLAMIFPTPPQAAYSENGRRHLLYEVQKLLREKELYSSTQDGKEGKGTHNAIVLFQAKNGLVPNGLLDGPTLAAMSLATVPDNPDWKAPAVASSPGRRRSATPKEEPNFLQRTGKSIGKFFRGD